MKSIASLFAGTLMITLLDLAPLPSKSSCKDNNPKINTVLEYLDIIGFRVYVNKSGPDWIEFSYTANGNINKDLYESYELGIEYWYKEKDKHTHKLELTDSPVKLLQSGDKLERKPEMEWKNFTITGLKPGKTYTYRPYYKKILSNKTTYGPKSTFTTHKK